MCSGDAQFPSRHQCVLQSHIFSPFCLNLYFFFLVYLLPQTKKWNWPWSTSSKFISRYSLSVQPLSSTSSCLCRGTTDCLCCFCPVCLLIAFIDIYIFSAVPALSVTSAPLISINSDISQVCWCSTITSSRHPIKRGNTLLILVQKKRSDTFPEAERSSVTRRKKGPCHTVQRALLIKGVHSTYLFDWKKSISRFPVLEHFLRSEKLKKSPIMIAD